MNPLEPRPIFYFPLPLTILHLVLNRAPFLCGFLMLFPQLSPLCAVVLLIHPVRVSRYKLLLPTNIQKNATSPEWCATDKYNCAGRLVEDTFLRMGLHQLVDFPTHIHPDGSFGSLLDLFLVSSDKMISDILSLPPLGKSDHISLLCNFNLRKDTPPKATHLSVRGKTIWCYERANHDVVNQALKEAFTDTWNFVRNAESIDDAWTCWQQVFLSTVKRRIPHKIITKQRRKNPHVTKEIEQLIKEKRYAYRRFKKNPSPELRLRFTTIRNKVTARIRKAERAYASTLHRQAQLSPSKSTSRDFWHFVRNLTGKSQRKPPSLLIDPLSQQKFSTPESKANLLNRFFVEQTNLDVPANSKPDATSVPVNPCSFTYLETTPTAVFKVLSTLKTHKAGGLDNIPARLLKYCAIGITDSLTCLFNRSFELSEFPTAWKEALVVPIHKKGSMTDPGNYRPIALLPIVSKVLERIVHDKLSPFLQPWLQDKQSGFKKGDGTVPQLLRLCQDWNKQIDSSSYVGALFFDLKKAFDRVWHDGLLVKVEAAGIRGSALAWIRSFLSLRRQITTIEGFSSSSIEIRAGVPQGAILSPLLFSIYVNDIVYAAPLCDTNLFADDTSAYVSSPCPTLLNTSLQSAADSLSDWFDRWHLSIHPSKTVCMALRSRGMPPCPLYIYINGKRIAQVSQHCHLGVTFNDTLSWKDHVHKIVLQSARKIGLLRRLGRHLSPTVLRDIYLFCIRPGVEYSSVVWSGLTSSDAVRLERNNRSAARLILKTSRKEDISHELLLSRAGLSTLEARRNVAQCAVVRKAFLGRHPGHLQKVIARWVLQSTTGSQRQSPRRNRFQVKLPRPTKVKFKQSPLYCAASTWNTLIHSHTANKTLPSMRDISNFFVT